MPTPTKIRVPSAPVPDLARPYLIGASDARIAPADTDKWPLPVPQCRCGEAT